MTWTRADFKPISLSPDRSAPPDAFYCPAEHAGNECELCGDKGYLSRWEMMCVLTDPDRRVMRSDAA